MFVQTASVSSAQRSIQGLYLDDPRIVDALAGGAAGMSRAIQLHLPSMCNVQLSNANCFDLALAGGLTAVFVSPLEVLKTRLQTQVKGQGTKYLGGVHIYGTVSQLLPLSVCPLGAAPSSTQILRVLLAGCTMVYWLADEVLLH